MTPTPREVAAKLRKAAAELEGRGDKAVEMADMLVSRGYPASTIGDGGSRSTDSTSSTERAALNPSHQYVAVDVRLRAAIKTADVMADLIIEMCSRVLAHAGDEDPLPAGSGACQCCDRMCRPDQRKGDRLRAGYCPGCYAAWYRVGQPDRFRFERDRRMVLGMSEKEAS